MAKFELAEEITGRNEGGYANNPADTGGETFAGIARNHWPKWEGWNFIDQFKADFKNTKSKLSLAQWVNASAKATPVLLGQISRFYKNNFWDSLKLDLVNDQQLANSVYDFGVNSGTSRAAKYLQNVASVTEDGIIGKQTLSAVNSLNQRYALTAYNNKREAFYRSIAKGNQAQFLKSWLSRLKPYK